MSMKLYFAPGACSFVPHCLLEASGQPYEPAMVKLHKQENYSDEFKALNPRSQVPVLVDGGEAITQIVAIIMHLDARLPGGVLPASGLARTRAIETLAWMNNTVHPTFTHIFLPHKFTDKPEMHGDLKAYNTQLYRGMLGELETHAQAMRRRGDAWLAGGTRFGPLDVYALTLLRWGTIAGIDPATYPALWAHVQTVAADGAVARVMERERLQLNLYQPA
jgi:glutathione S-transferase